MSLLHPTAARWSATEQRAPRARLAPASAAAALWALGFALINATAGLPSNSQLWWQVRQGELTLSTGHAVLRASWSWTAGAVSWIPNSWGWGTLLAIAYRGAGVYGVVVFVLLAQLGVLWLAWHVLGRVGLRGVIRLGVLVVLSLNMSGWANGQSELADYAATFAFAAVCLSPRVERFDGWARAGALAVAAFVVAAVWENLHLGGLASIVVFVAVAMICLPRRAGRELVAVAVGAGLGVLATPAGASGIAKSLVTASKSEAEHYAAWGALFAQPSSYNYGPAILALVIGLAALALVLRRRDWVAAAVLALGAIATCVVVRSGPDLVMLSILAAGVAATRLPAAARPAWTERMLRPEHPRISAGALALAAVWLVVSLGVAGASVTPSWRLVGVDPSDLAPIPTGARVYSTIHASDAIDVLRPDLRVTIDSRNDLYPVDEFEFARSLTGANAAEAADWFSDNGVTAVFLSGAPAHESRSTLAKDLTDAGWHSHPGTHGLVLLSPRTAPRS